MIHPNFDIEKLIAYLPGENQSLSEILKRLFDMTEDDLTEEDHKKIDSEVFQCEECGWWYGQEDRSDNICIDCSEEN